MQLYLFIYQREGDMSNAIVSVGSQNKMKVAAVEDAFKLVWPGVRWSVTGLEVASGVAEQPIGYDDVKAGALNRAKAALEHELAGGADFGVGLEGGLINFDGTSMECGIIAVIKSPGIVGIGHTAAIQVPPPFVARLQSGETIDDIFAKDYGIEDIGRSESGGFMAYMTNGGIKRREAYRDGVIFALARFVQPNMYEE